METKGVQEALEQVHHHQHCECHTPEGWPENDTHNDGHPHVVILKHCFEDQCHEGFGKLTMCKGQSPETKI